MAIKLIIEEFETCQYYCINMHLRKNIVSAQSLPYIVAMVHETGMNLLLWKIAKLCYESNKTFTTSNWEGDKEILMGIFDFWTIDLLALDLKICLIITYMYF